MLTPAELIEGVNFIFVECHRLQKLIEKDFKSIGKGDHWFMLPHPNGQGHMICGGKAYLQLQKLSVHASERAGLRRRVTSETMTRAVGDAIVKQFLKERQPINEEQINLAFDVATRAATQEVKDRIHFVPCHLMAGKEPEELLIGPVSFLSKRVFQRLICASLREQLDLERGNEKYKFARDIMRDGLRYYRNFEWVACVEVVGCDEEEGDRLARRAVVAALDCLHLMLGGGATDKMRVGGPAITADRRAKIYQTGDGNLHASISRSWMGQVGFRDGWSEQLLGREDVRRMFYLCGVALEAAVNPDVERPLSRRFLDATLWFGEGVREESAAASVVKFVTALERTFMTERVDRIGWTLAERLSAACTIAYQGTKYKSRQEWFEETRKAYRLRSKLVHGSISPESDEVRKAVYSCMKLTEAALLSALSLAKDYDLRRDDLMSNQLTAMFKRVVAHADRIEPLEKI